MLVFPKNGDIKNELCQKCDYILTKEYSSAKILREQCLNCSLGSFFDCSCVYDYKKILVVTCVSCNDTYTKYVHEPAGSCALTLRSELRKRQIADLREFAKQTYARGYSSMKKEEAIDYLMPILLEKMQKHNISIE